MCGCAEPGESGVHAPVARTRAHRRRCRHLRLATLPRSHAAAPRPAVVAARHCLCPTPRPPLDAPQPPPAPPPPAAAPPPPRRRPAARPPPPAAPQPTYALTRPAPPQQNPQAHRTPLNYAGTRMSAQPETLSPAGLRTLLAEVGTRDARQLGRRIDKARAARAARPGRGRRRAGAEPPGRRAPSSVPRGHATPRTCRSASAATTSSRRSATTRSSSSRARPARARPPSSPRCASSSAAASRA